MKIILNIVIKYIMTQIIHINTFNNVLDEFINYIDLRFDHLKYDIFLTKNALSLLRIGNPKLVIEQFLEYALPYESQIFDCNEEFFLNLSSEDIQTEFNSFGLSFLNNNLFASKLRKIWLSPDMSEIDKAKVFYYFQKLIIIGKNCNKNN